MKKASIAVARAQKHVSRATLIQRASNYFVIPNQIEMTSAGVLFVLLVAVKILNIFHQSFDRDEPQHLHVIWQWVRGFVQYRDFFDLHMPLFHIVFAPVAALIGERATILYWMRFAIFPLYFVVLWCAYQIAQKLFSRRVGVWTVLAVAAYPGYGTAIGFGPGNLWVALWLLCVVILMRGAIDVRRSLGAGVLMGLCFGVSPKSAVLLLSLGAGAALTAVVVRPRRFGESRTYLSVCVGTFLAMSFAIPAIIVLFFALKGVWPDMRSCVFEFGSLVGPLYKDRLFYLIHPMWAALILTLTLAAIVYIAHWIDRNTADRCVAARRVFILIVSASYILVVQIFWPPLSRTYKPVYLLSAALIVGAFLGAFDRLLHQKWGILRLFRFLPLPVLVVIAEFFLPLRKHSLFQDRTTNQTGMLRAVLALTEPDDYILDCEGETIFRRRCFRPVLDRLTMKAIERGIVAGTAPQRCIETHTCVVATRLMQRYPPTTREFIQHNYLPIGNKLSVAGAVLERSKADSRRCDFEVVIPATYRIVSTNGDVSGVLDSVLLEGPRFLEPGPHSFESSASSGPLILLWAQAIERHFRPSVLRASNDAKERAE